jgi:hypothetical protein
MKTALAKGFSNELILARQLTKTICKWFIPGFIFGYSKIRGI